MCKCKKYNTVKIGDIFEVNDYPVYSGWRFKITAFNGAHFSVKTLRRPKNINNPATIDYNSIFGDCMKERSPVSSVVSFISHECNADNDMYDMYEQLAASLNTK
ncbi:MAG: hypothetical protein AABY22_32605 [Nanoarchaeota archaeon]